MPHPLARLLVALALVSGAGAVGSTELRAQADAVMDQPPPPLPATDPRAKIAAGLVERVMRADRPAAEAYLREHGTAGYAGSDDMRRQLERNLPKAAVAGYRIVAFRKGMGQDVVVEVDAAGEFLPLAVRFDPAAPARIVGLLRLRTDVE